MGDVKVDCVITNAERILTLERSQLILKPFSTSVVSDTHRDHTLDRQFIGHLAAKPDYVPVPDVSRLRRPKHLEKGHRVDIGLRDCLRLLIRPFKLPDGDLCTFEVPLRARMSILPLVRFGSPLCPEIGTGN